MILGIARYIFLRITYDYIHITYNDYTLSHITRIPVGALVLVILDVASCLRAPAARALYHSAAICENNNM